MTAKKVLVSIVGVAALYCGAAYVSGYVGEKDVRLQLEQMKAQPQASEYDIQLLEYRRGVFSSDIRIGVKARQATAEGIQPDITVDNAIQHGPLLFAGKPAVGAYAATSTFQIKTGVPEHDQKIAEVFDKGFGTAVSVVQYNGDYDTTWVLPALDHKNIDSQFSLGETRLAAKGNAKTQSGSGELTVGQLDVTAKDGAVLKMTPTVAKFTVKNIEPGMNLVEFDAAIAQLDVRSTTKPPVQLQGLTMKQSQTLAGASINSSFKLGAARLSGPVELENFYYTMDLNGVSKEATQRMATLFQNQPTDPEQQKAYMAAQFKELAPLLLKNGLSLKLATGANYGGGTPQAQWLIQYKEPADGRDIFAIADPLEYLQLADSTLLVKAPAALVPEPLIAQFIDTYVVREGSEYVLRANLQNGSLTVGKTPIPKEMLAAMLAGMNKEKQPPAAAQRKRRP